MDIKTVAKIILAHLEATPEPPMSDTEVTALREADYNATATNPSNVALAIRACKHIASGNTIPPYWDRPDNRTLSRDPIVRRYSLLLAASAHLSIASEYATDRPDISERETEAAENALIQYELSA